MDSECISLEGYQWFGSNRKLLSRRAMRGSGGVGVLIKHSLSECYSISIADADIEGILWLQFTGIDGSENFSIVVCYLPPANSSRGDMSNEFFDHLKSDIFTLQGSGVYCICGDFNARCGSLSDVDSSPDHDIPCRVLTDLAPPNKHGRSMIDFLKCTGLCVLNGRSREGCGYTSVSTKGLAVVDYCMVPLDCYSQFTNFRVLDVVNLAEELNINGRHQ